MKNPTLWTHMKKAGLLSGPELFIIKAEALTIPLYVWVMPGDKSESLLQRIYSLFKAWIVGASFAFNLWIWVQLPAASEGERVCVSCRQLKGETLCINVESGH